MSGLFIFLVVLVALAVFDVLTQTHGVDSRTDFTDPRTSRTYN